MLKLRFKDWLICQLASILLSLAYLTALAWRTSASRLRRAARPQA